MSTPTINNSNAANEPPFLGPQDSPRANVKSNGLPHIEHLEADDFAARVRAGSLHLTSIGSENAYAVDDLGTSFYAKGVPPAVFEQLHDACTRSKFHLYKTARLAAAATFVGLKFVPASGSTAEFFVVTPPTGRPFGVWPGELCDFCL